MKIIDPHLHLFALDRGDYAWLKPKNAPFWPDKAVIAKSFIQDDLKLTKPLSLAGFVHIEAGFDNQQPWREIAWLEESITQPFRSVAMLDITLAQHEFTEQLTKLKQYKSVVGIRHILDEQAEEVLSHNNTLINLTTLANNQLSFDIQMPLSNDEAVECLDKILIKVPKLQCCLNHAGWPPACIDEASNWHKNIKHLAKYSNLFVKCSGFEMTDRHYSLTWQYWVISTIYQYFGQNRTMLASNFPLSLWRSSYTKTWQHYTQLNSISSPLSHKALLEKLLFKNAYHFYKFASII